MKSRFAVGLGLCVILLALTLWLGACQDLKHLDGPEFLQHAGRLGVDPKSTRAYIGASTDRAYIEVQTMGTLSRGWHLQVFWTYLKDLPPHIADELRAGRNPWKIATGAEATPTQDTSPRLPR
jgi:hypothetical protein